MGVAIGEHLRQIAGYLTTALISVLVCFGQSSGLQLAEPAAGGSVRKAPR
jgi:hypothetical protein